jgi:hypothetical protein
MRWSFPDSILYGGLLREQVSGEPVGQKWANRRPLGRKGLQKWGVSIWPQPGSRIDTEGPESDVEFRTLGNRKSSSRAKLHYWSSAVTFIPGVQVYLTDRIDIALSSDTMAMDFPTGKPSSLCDLENVGATRGSSFPIWLRATLGCTALSRGWRLNQLSLNTRDERASKRLRFILVSGECLRGAPAQPERHGGLGSEPVCPKRYSSMRRLEEPRQHSRRSKWSERVQNG